MRNPTALPKPRLFSAWLALAVLLHAGLLLLPMPPREAAESRSPALRLALPAPARVTPRADSQPAPPPLARPPEAADPRPAPPPRTPQTPVPERTFPDPAPATIDSFELLDAVRRLERGRDAPPHRLGVFRAPPPPNGRTALPGGHTLFEGTLTPGDVRVVDRWLAADGSHNVVIETPNGETLCGRAEAWDPMRPLVEHVMMFRTCGGGGERSFEMPEHYRRAR